METNKMADVGVNIFFIVNLFLLFSFLPLEVVFALFLYLKSCEQMNA